MTPSPSRGRLWWKIYLLMSIKGKVQSMKKTLIVIDMQNDFIDGSLGTAEAVKIVDNVKKK